MRCKEPAVARQPMGFSRDKSLERVRAAPAVAPPDGKAARRERNAALRRQPRAPKTGNPAREKIPPAATLPNPQNRARALPKRPCPNGASSVAPHPHSAPCPAGQGSAAKTASRSLLQSGTKIAPLPKTPNTPGGYATPHALPHKAIRPQGGQRQSPGKRIEDPLSTAPKLSPHAQRQPDGPCSWAVRRLALPPSAPSGMTTKRACPLRVGQARAAPTRQPWPPALPAGKINVGFPLQMRGGRYNRW